MKIHPICLMLLALGALAAVARPAQAQNFFGGGATAFDPQISILTTGALLDTQAVVSADRKYVTLTMRPQLSSLIALREFTFQRGQPQGFVGGGGVVSGQAPAPAAKPAAAAAAKAPAANRPPKSPTVATLLDREGMVQINDAPDARGG